MLLLHSRRLAMIAKASLLTELMLDVPPKYRAWTLADYSPAVANVLEPFLSGKVWCAYLTGSVGTRKSSLAAAILRRMRKALPGSTPGRSGDGTGCWGEFVTPELFRVAINDFKGIGKQQISDWKNARLLVIDDLGVLANTAYAQEQQLHLVCRRYDRELPTIVTSNLSLDELARQLDLRVSSRLQEGILLDLGTKDTRKDRT